MKAPFCAPTSTSAMLQQFCSSSYTIQINLHYPLSPWQLCFLSQVKAHLTLQFLSPLFLFSSFWEIKTGHLVWVTPSERTPSIIPVSSHLACKQDRIGERFFWTAPFPDNSSRRKCYSQLHWNRPCPRHLSMLSKGARAFDTFDRVNATATQQMTQQYDQITFRFKRPNSLIFPQLDTKGYCFSHLFSTFSKQSLKDSKSRAVEEDNTKRLSSLLITG